ASRVTIVVRYAFGERISNVETSEYRSQASCKTSSASVALPSMRYAIENSSVPLLQVLPQAHPQRLGSRRHCAASTAFPVSASSQRRDDPLLLTHEQVVSRCCLNLQQQR